MWSHLGMGSCFWHTIYLYWDHFVCMESGCAEPDENAIYWYQTKFIFPNRTSLVWNTFWVEMEENVFNVYICQQLLCLYCKISSFMLH